MLKYSILDTETGGLDHDVNGLASVGLISPDNKSLYMLVKPVPGLIYSEEALAVNGFTLEQLERNGVPEPVALASAMSFIKEECGGSFLCGSNIPFDMDFMKSAAKRCGGEIEEFFTRKLHRRTCELQTVALMAHDLGIIQLPDNPKDPSVPSYSLDAVLSCLDMKRSTEVHTASEDCLLTRAALMTLRKKMFAAIGRSEEGGESQTPELGNAIENGLQGKQASAPSRSESGEKQL